MIDWEAIGLIIKLGVLIAVIGLAVFLLVYITLALVHLVNTLSHIAQACP